MGVSTLAIPVVSPKQSESLNEVDPNPFPKMSPLCFENTLEFLMQDVFSSDSASENITTDISEFKNEMAETWDNLKTLLMYNVPNGKKIRGRLLVSAYMKLAPDSSEDMRKLVFMLGWSLEILQAAYLVADDIMDNGHLRRGQPCWHSLENVGITAVNDCFLLEHAAYQIIHKYFHHLHCYTDLLDLLLGITFKTILGQSLDIHSSMKSACDKNSSDSFEKFNDKLYSSIVRYKTGYYTCYLPVALAMSLAGISKENNKSLWEQVEQVTLAIGHLFQIQDDYFDCFGDETVIGKVGSDIQEGKCTWLFVTAKETMQSQMDFNSYKILTENYGQFDEAKVAIVKQLYCDLGLPETFEKYQEKMLKNIGEMIAALSNTELQDILSKFLELIYKRVY